MAANEAEGGNRRFTVGSKEMKIQEARYGPKTQRQTLQTTNCRSTPVVCCTNFESSHSPKSMLFINCRDVAKGIRRMGL